MAYVEKKEVKKALEKAKLLEKEPEPLPTRESEVEVYKETVSLSEKLKSLLKPEWFVKDVHKPCRKCDRAKKLKKVIRAKPSKKMAKKKAAAAAAKKKKK